jgi:Zn finger protein HypA/HybF involved in hydrogenase expression
MEHITKNVSSEPTIALPIEGSCGVFFQTVDANYFYCKCCGNTFKYEQYETVGTACPDCLAAELEEV